jgi:hypothetical protein
MLANPAAEGGTMGERWPRNFDESGDFHVIFGFFYMPLSTTWDRRLYFPSEGRILVIYWKKTGLLHTKISNHNIIYSL